MRKVINYLNQLLKPNDTLVIATSGGPDSMCLLDLCLNLKSKLNLQIIVAHINHKLRKESEEEAQFVSQYAHDHNLIYEYHEIKEYNLDNLESEARIKRYTFLDSIVHKYQAQYLMTAHHGDDLIETILMRLARGSSLKGYAGLKQEVDLKTYKIIRPLIYVTKTDILAYLHQNNLQYFIDQSNYSEKYTRNRYRLHILPFLKQENPNIHLKFLKFSEELSAANDFIIKYLTELKQQISTEEGYSIPALKKLDSFILQKFLEEELRPLYPTDLFLVSAKNINEIIKLIKSPASNGYINLPKGFIASKSYNNLKIVHPKNTLNYNFELSKEVILPTGRIKEISSSSDSSNYTLRLNLKDLKLPLIVRTRHDGDKMAVKNLNGTKKLKDIFIDEKVPLNKRDQIPIVVDQNNTILWICGLKKSKFDIPINKKYDIILTYEEENI